ncbi:MAG: DUF7405 family protein [Natronomonas sp.]
MGLAGCTERFVGSPDTPAHDLEVNPRVEDLPRRQHAWNGALDTNADNNRLPPRYYRILLLSLAGKPTEDDANTVEHAMRTLEAAYNFSTVGLLHMLAWGTDYFDRLDRLDTSPIDHPQVISRTDDPDLLSFDASLVLASDVPSTLHAVEDAMFGSRSELAGEAVRERLGDVLSVRDRRTGFLGEGLPAQHANATEVPRNLRHNAPDFMGFFSNVRGAQASEDRVTIQGGTFDGGTTMHLSHLRQGLEDWWEMDDIDRVVRMFSPEFTPEEVQDLGTTIPFADAVNEHAREEAIVGHWEKVARVREDGQPLLLRRDFNTVDNGEAGVHFLSLQRELSDFVKTRDAMNGWWLREDHESPGNVNERENNGILNFIEVQSRANFYVPPREQRAFP